MSRADSLAAIERFIKQADMAEMLRFVEKLAAERPDVYAALMKKLSTVAKH